MIFILCVFKDPNCNPGCQDVNPRDIYDTERSFLFLFSLIFLLGIKEGFPPDPNPPPPAGMLLSAPHSRDPVLGLPHTWPNGDVGTRVWCAGYRAAWEDHFPHHSRANPVYTSLGDASSPPALEASLLSCLAGGQGQQGLSRRLSIPTVLPLPRGSPCPHWAARRR